MKPNNFFADGRFKYNVSQYDATSQIISLGGKYKIQCKKIAFTVQYTIEDEGGVLKIGALDSDTDSWSLQDGKRVTKNVAKPFTQYANFKFATKENKPWISINMVEYYKINDDPNKFD